MELFSLRLNQNPARESNQLNTELFAGRAAPSFRQAGETGLKVFWRLQGKKFSASF